MTIETSLHVGYVGNAYTLIVKMIRMEGSSYFFIKDKVGEKSLLDGKTLELTYLNSFSLTEFGGIIKSPGIPGKIVAAIQKSILDNKEMWFY